MKIGHVLEDSTHPSGIGDSQSHVGVKPAQTKNIVILSGFGARILLRHECASGVCGDKKKGRFSKGASINGDLQRTATKVQFSMCSCNICCAQQTGKCH
jgi:hypothetical protein